MNRDRYEDEKKEFSYFFADNFFGKKLGKHLEWVMTIMKDSTLGVRPKISKKEYE